MFNTSLFARCFGVLLGVLVSASLVNADDLSKYRPFQFGMDLTRAAEAGGMHVSDAKVIHQRPGLIQELTWRPDRSPLFSISDPVTDVVLSFYNGELFRMAVEYDRYKTRGMTLGDMTEAISAIYGTATLPLDEIAVASTLRGNMNVVARWEDSQYLCDLLHPTDEPVFYLILSSKRVDAMARSAVVEAVRIEAEQAPQKEIDDRNKQEQDRLLQLDNARVANKPKFRP
jgi:hypothetical protein